MPAPSAPHPYLSGLNAPMDSELTLTDLVVDGAALADGIGLYAKLGFNG